ncbi:MAG TPA: thymidylate kinase [Terracidiphilus sp.]|jgi:thymidylate kinase|nr:thymidylate kinase [Terracidiphilus sp.]
MSPHGKKSAANIVSFSGIDGAGKSTQIEALQTYLKDIGFQVVTIRFWDDVARLKSIRESAGHTLFKGDKGVGTPDAPITRKDKNVQSWPMTCIRLVLYFIDAVSARNAVKNALRSDADFIIFDRYCYDEMANLNLRNGLLRKYVLLLIAIVPALGRSYLLDADPAQARERKPEYPLDFVSRNRAAYLDMCNLTGRMTIISSMNIDEVRREILRYTIADLSTSSHAGGDNGSRNAARRVETKKLDGTHTHPAS